MHTTSETPLHARKQAVPHEFDRVAGSYDLLTALNPGYKKHLRWSAERLELRPGARVLDLCCGTGLSTLALVRACPTAKIDALDASEGMLAVARKKRQLRNVRLFHGDAMRLADAGLDGPYDAVLMAYGIRNMPDVDLALRGVARVLAPGGRVCFHEYSVRDSARSRLVWNLVTGSIIIPAGLVASGTADIYRYLRESVLAFDGASAFEERLRRAGYVNVRTLAMDGWQAGIVHSFIAEVPR
jgi:ubiquinone/menaquinone biosynthesis methyltransferase